MSDLQPLLENRADLEKLEQDLAALDSRLVSGELPEEIIKLANQARVDLEAARAAHLALYFRLSSQAPLERAAARQELERWIEAGELKIYDPEARRWRPAAEILLKANHLSEELDRQAVESHQLEHALSAAVDAPHNLKEINQLIHRAEELERRGQLSLVGQDALQKARLVYKQGLQLHRELSLKIHNGSLQERFEALTGLKKMISAGEMRIMDAPAEQWRPAADMLAEAECEYAQASTRQADSILQQVEEIRQTGLKLALRTLYLALDKKIPYTENDRRRLEARYLELYASSEQVQPALEDEPEISAPVSPADLEGFKDVREIYLKKIAAQFNQSAQWLNQFFRSAFTTPVTALMEEAEAKDTPLATAVERIAMAEALARNTLEGSIEIPEVMVRGAVILFNKGQPERAKELLSRAKLLYTLERSDKVHRNAVTAWLQGCVEYSLARRMLGYTEWKIARSYFRDLQQAARREKQTEKEKWYQNRLFEMDTLAIQTFEEVYFQWMNQFEPMALSTGLQDYRRMMDIQFGKKQINELRKTIQSLLEASQRELQPEMHRRALVDAAFFEYQLRDYRAAIDHLYAAWVGFQAGHRGAVTLWLLGMVSWWLPSRRNDAILDWETSIRIFEDLRREADHTNHQDRRRWYDAQITQMETSLQQWVILTMPH